METLAVIDKDPNTKVATSSLDTAKLIESAPNAVKKLQEKADRPWLRPDFFLRHRQLFFFSFSRAHCNFLKSFRTVFSFFRIFTRRRTCNFYW